MGSTYERELKGILAGEEDVLRRVTKALAPPQARALRKAADKPFLVVRGAGSLGVDLVALRGDVSFPIEVKSAAADVIRFSDGSKRNHQQAEDMARACSRASVIPLYAYRRKGLRGEDPWRIHTLPCADLPPRIALLYERIPKVDKTARGNFVMRWDEGLALHRLVDLLCS